MKKAGVKLGPTVRAAFKHNHNEACARFKAAIVRCGIRNVFVLELTELERIGLEKVAARLKATPTEVAKEWAVAGITSELERL